MHLAREVAAVREPDGKSIGTEELSDIHHVPVMPYGLLTDGRVRVAERAELVAVLLAGLVLEGVGVDRVKAEAKPGCVLAQCARVLRLIPWQMQRDAGRSAAQPVNFGNIVHFLKDVTRLARAGKPAEARAARAESP